MIQYLSMETLLPQVFTYAFFAPTILRIVVAIVLIGAARKSFKERRRGKMIGVVLGILSGLLFLGLLTQLATVFAILNIVWLNFQKKTPSLFHNRTIMVLTFAILLSLFVTGPGAMAIDLPY